jgi:phytoene dehydrogenase-like protein
LLAKETIPLMIFGVSKSLPGLAQFYMAGHWVEPGGTVTLAAASGKNAIQLICADEGRSFVTNRP